MTILFQRIVTELKPFFGHRTDEFIRRQCAHIRVKPEELKEEDVQALVYWVGTSSKLVLSSEKVKQVVEKISSFIE